MLKSRLSSGWNINEKKQKIVSTDNPAQVTEILTRFCGISGETKFSTEKLAES